MESEHKMIVWIVGIIAAFFVVVTVSSLTYYSIKHVSMMEHGYQYDTMQGADVPYLRKAKK